MKKFHNTSSLFAQFRKVLLQHDQLRAEYESTLNEYDNDNEYMNVSPSIVHDLRAVVNDSRCTPSKLAKVSLASASLVYMYIGLLEYADAWQQSAADRKVVDFTKKKLFEVDQLSRSKKLFVSILKAKRACIA